jgi:Helix-turn-helix domain
MSWVLNLAPVPADRSGPPSSAGKFVLVGLASHAGQDGSGAFPSVATLVRYTGLSERTVRTCLGRLEAGGIICPCDPDVVAARIKRADRRPKGWDLDLCLIRDGLSEADLAALKHQFPGLRARVAAAACPDADGVLSEQPVSRATPGRWPCTATPEREPVFQRHQPAPGWRPPSASSYPYIARRLDSARCPVGGQQVAEERMLPNAYLCIAWHISIETW